MVNKLQLNNRKAVKATTRFLVESCRTDRTRRHSIRDGACFVLFCRSSRSLCSDWAAAVALMIPLATSGRFVPVSGKLERLPATVAPQLSLCIEARTRPEPWVRVFSDPSTSKSKSRVIGVRLTSLPFLSTRRLSTKRLEERRRFGSYRSKDRRQRVKPSRTVWSASRLCASKL